jgi:nitric oxide reductase subunit B
MLFSLRHVLHPAAWSDRLLKVAFWGLNLGLAGMIALSLVPSGFYQFLEAVRHGTWWARSAAVTQSEFIRTVTWLRVLPDIVFLTGVAALCAFVVRGILLDIRLRRSGGKEV